MAKHKLDYQFMVQWLVFAVLAGSGRSLVDYRSASVMDDLATGVSYITSKEMERRKDAVNDRVNKFS